MNNQTSIETILIHIYSEWQEHVKKRKTSSYRTTVTINRSFNNREKDRSEISSLSIDKEQGSRCLNPHGQY